MIPNHAYRDTKIIHGQDGSYQRLTLSIQDNGLYELSSDFIGKDGYYRPDKSFTINDIALNKLEEVWK